MSLVRSTWSHHCSSESLRPMSTVWSGGGSMLIRHTPSGTEVSDLTHTEDTQHVCITMCACACNCIHGEYDSANCTCLYGDVGIYEESVAFCHVAKNQLHALSSSSAGLDTLKKTRICSFSTWRKPTLCSQIPLRSEPPYFPLQWPANTAEMCTHAYTCTCTAGASWPCM